MLFYNIIHFYSVFVFKPTFNLNKFICQWKIKIWIILFSHSINNIWNSLIFYP